MKLQPTPTKLQSGGLECLSFFYFLPKPINQRPNSETDIDEVLQSHRVFLNVSKGIVAKKEDLNAFGHSNEEKACLEVKNNLIKRINISVEFIYFLFF